MMQTSLLPERIRRIDPNPIPSADSPGIGVAYSGQRYVLKVASPAHPWLPASEWISHGLAQAMEMAVPHWTVCVLPGGALCFGSRFEGLVTAQQFLPTQPPATDNPHVLGAAYVFDLFTANNDRHPGNWLETEAAGVRLLRPIDCSRALLWRWPLPTPPFGPGDNSGMFYTLALATRSMPLQDARDALGLVVNLKKDVWRTIVESVPDGWLPESLARELINWWWSPQWHTRTRWIKAQL